MLNKIKLVLLNKNKRLMVRSIFYRISNIGAQALFVLLLPLCWSMSDVGIYMALVSIFNLATLVSASGVEKFLIRQKSNGVEGYLLSSPIYDSLFTQASIFSFLLSIVLFKSFYPASVSYDLWAAVFVGCVGCSLRFLTARIEGASRYVEMLDVQLMQTTLSKVVLIAAVLFGVGAVSIFMMEIIVGAVSSYFLCFKYSLSVRASLYFPRWSVYKSIFLMLGTKTAQQLGVRYLLLAPVSNADFSSAGVFGLIQKGCAVLTNIAEFVLQRLYARHALFSERQDFDGSYRKGVRVVTIGALIFSALSVLGVLIIGGRKDVVVATVLTLLSSPFLVWRAQLTNRITQDQSYWISLISYMPSVFVLYLASVKGYTHPVELAVVLLLNVSLNVGFALILLRVYGEKPASDRES